MSNKTNFAAMTPSQIKVWSREVWKTARDQSFVMQFAATDINSPVYRVTELTKTTRGDKAIVPLVTDLEGDGVTGDFQLEDHEEPLKAYEEDIQIDQLRNANRTTGRMADQRTIINFREQSRDKLGYWLGNRIDQMGMLTLAGMDYRMRNDGRIREGWAHTGSAWERVGGATPTNPEGYTLYDLAFAKDVTAPTANRYYRWNGAAKSLAAANTTAIAPVDTPSYQMLVETKAQMVTNYIRGVKTGKGGEVYHVFMHPKALAKLKLDPDFLANTRNAGPRDKKNTVWSGAIETVDGLLIHEHRLVPNTLGATLGTTAGHAGRPGYKWGANGAVNGSAMLFLGAQALGLCTLSTPNWEEERFDYKNQLGIAIDQIFGLRKPRFHSIYNNGVEDFGVVRVDVAI